MNRELLGLTAALWLIGGALSLGQTESPRPRETSGGQASRAPAEENRSAQMFEDIEVMRHLLRRALPTAYGLSAGVAILDYGNEGNFDLNSDGGISGSLNTHVTRYLLGDTATDPAHPVDTLPGYRYLLRAQGKAYHGAGEHGGSQVEGNYLKGQGVLFSLQLPPPANDPRPSAPKAAPKPPSQWESIRKELRGEKTDAKSDEQPRPDVRLADVLIKLLAENGRHFSQLADNEAISFAVTFRGNMCTSCHMPFTSGKFDTGGGGKKVHAHATGTSADNSSAAATAPATPAAGDEGKAPAGGTPAPNPAANDPSGNPQSQASGGTALSGRDESTRRAAVRALEWIGRQQKPDMTSQVLSELLFTGQTDEVQNYILLGDLHLKQGRPGDAADSYKKALEAKRKAAEKEDTEILRRIYLDLTGTPPGAEAMRAFLADNDPQKRARLTERLLKDAKNAHPDQLSAFITLFLDEKVGNQAMLQRDLANLELYTKLAQAYLSAGDKDRALRTVELLAKQAQSAGQVVQGRRDKPAEPAKTASGAAKMPLPSRLIISAPKRLLDLVGSGKVSYEEFKQQVTIQYYPFAEKK